eukprot:TRINITY_DN11666_c0_g1_i5.p1 TRINITY_DN11666_c0_g1~~TRINITY_DN11666_c0_g1_i5.p1  ORF type:complete len:118 (-),score=16.49 TRINITY_DN11666_c0_g1_i5:394-747(-)
MVKKRHILHKKTPSGGQFQSMQVPTNKVCRVQKLISTKDNEETLKNELKAKCEQIKERVEHLYRKSRHCGEEAERRTTDFDRGSPSQRADVTISCDTIMSSLHSLLSSIQQSSLKHS